VAPTLLNGAYCNALLLAHGSVCQKLNHVSSVQLRRSVCALKAEAAFSQTECLATRTCRCYRISTVYYCISCSCPLLLLLIQFNSIVGHVVVVYVRCHGNRSDLHHGSSQLKPLVKLFIEPHHPSRVPAAANNSTIYWKRPEVLNLRREWCCHNGVSVQKKQDRATHLRLTRSPAVARMGRPLPPMPKVSVRLPVAESKQFPSVSKVPHTLR